MKQCKIFKINTGIQALGVFMCFLSGVCAQLSNDSDSIDASIKEAAVYHFGDSRQAWDRIEKRVAAVAFLDGERQKLAAKLAALLESEATLEAQQQACIQLSYIGGKAEAPILARQLFNTNLSYYARQALERIPDESAASALIESMRKSSGVLQNEIIRSLGARRDHAIIPALMQAAKGKDAIGAVIDALAKMGSENALESLAALEPATPPELRSRLSEAILRNLQLLAPTGKTTPAKNLAQKLSKPENDQAIRIAAYGIHWQLAGNEGKADWLAALAGQDAIAQSAAMRFLHSNRNIDWFDAAVAILNRLPPQIQMQLISLAEQLGKSTIAPKLFPFALSADKDLARRTIKVLGVIGNESTVKDFCALYKEAEDADKKLVVEAWARLSGDSVEAALLESLKNESAATQIGLIRALVIRESQAAIPQFLALCGHPSVALRREAFKAIGTIGGADLCKSMIALMSSSTKDQQMIEEALSGICRRTHCIDPIVKALEDCGAGIRVSLLNVLATTGEREAQQTIARYAQSSEENVQLSAVRLQSDWPDAAPLNDLAKIARNSPSSTVKALAVRGVARHAVQAKDRSSNSIVAMLAQLLDSGLAINEQKMLVSALGEMRSWAALKVLAGKMTVPDLAGETSLAILKTIEAIGQDNRSESQRMLDQLINVSSDDSIKEKAKAMRLRFGEWQNLSMGAVADSPDGLDADGQSGGDQAAIDGNMETYWDEVDNQKRYRLRVHFKQKARVVFIRIIGWKHQEYAPKDFEILCDDKTIKLVKNAAYQNNQLTVEITPTECSALELKITQYYGASPAVRELEIYGKIVGE